MFILTDYPANVIQAANNMNTINNLTKLNLLADPNHLHYAELQFQPQLNQYIAEQQIMGNANYDQLNDESGFEEFNSGSVVDGDGSYNGPYSLKNSLSNNDLLSQQEQLQLANHLNKTKVNLQSDTTDQMEYAKLDFCNELLKSQMLNQAIQTNSPICGIKQSRVNVVSTGTTNDHHSNLNSNSVEQQTMNSNKYESTV